MKTSILALCKLLCVVVIGFLSSCATSDNGHENASIINRFTNNETKSRIAEQRAKEKQRIEQLKTKEPSDWRHANDNPSIDSYGIYLLKHPNGSHRYEAISEVKRLIHDIAKSHAIIKPGSEFPFSEFFSVDDILQAFEYFAVNSGRFITRANGIEYSDMSTRQFNYESWVDFYRGSIRGASKYISRSNVTMIPLYSKVESSLHSEVIATFYGHPRILWGSLNASSMGIDIYESDGEKELSFASSDSGVIVLESPGETVVYAIGEYEETLL